MPTAKAHFTLPLFPIRQYTARWALLIQPIERHEILPPLRFTYRSSNPRRR